ncbi:protein PLASTID REDOX INSENSITIVE 2, chloroplastic-like isoform X6 [Mangifera indica]|uniref:protein PLASTID REDOX INSENSITIVE 2, chloroplastic-like isoform X6 n=1 Tax=Mangifera indica TaxID=29780 RepID=UPI001CF9618B|nr:protein PLASTID REDOX INSENSITIVE 2, chloroplastic-like isoform X6 [Mangifera indica]
MALNIFNFNASLAVTPAKTPFITTLTLTTPFINLHPPPYSSFSFSSSAKLNSTPRASPPQKYSYPDPIPEFADAETRKFRAELLKKLSNETETFGNDLDTVVDVCAEYFPAPGVWRTRHITSGAFRGHVDCSKGKKITWSSLGCTDIPAMGSKQY